MSGESAEVRARLAAAFSGDEFEENAAAAAGEGEWSWFRWLALTAFDGRDEADARTTPNVVDGRTDPCPTPGYAGSHTAVGAGAISEPYRCHGCGAWFTLAPTSEGGRRDG